MKHLAILLFWGGVLAGGISCTNKVQDNKINNGAFFSLTDVLSGQSKYLEKLNLTVNRQSEINGKREEVFFKPDSSFWNKEFKIFEAADIDKPSLWDRYRINKSDSAGLQIVNYSAINPRLGGTVFLSAVRDTEGNLLDLAIRVKDKNLIYRSERLLNMKFQPYPSAGKYLLMEYTVTGYQKIILRKKIEYAIHVTLDRVN